MLERTLATLAIIVIFLGLVLVQIAPGWPKTITGWVLLAVVGVPLYVMLEVAGALFSEKAWGGRIGIWLSRRTEHKRFSWLRIGYALGIGLIALAVCAVGIALLDQSTSFRQFMSEHFAW